MIDWTVRLKMSVPPPAPAAPRNSTGLVGFHSACAACAANSATALPARTAPILNLDVIVPLPDVFVRGLRHLLVCRRARRHHRALALEGGDLLPGKPVLGQDLAGVLPKKGSTRPYLAR